MAVYSRLSNQKNTKQNYAKSNSRYPDLFSTYINPTVIPICECFSHQIIERFCGVFWAIKSPTDSPTGNNPDGKDIEQGFGSRLLALMNLVLASVMTAMARASLSGPRLGI